ncbi:MAG: hypothetical protein WCO42_00775 [bacterium]
MQLNDEQKTLVNQWVKEGCGLSEIQRRLTDQCKQNLTYMDVRFLIIELGLSIQDKVRSPAASQPIAPASEPASLPADADDDMPALPPEPPAGAGGVSVEVDRLTLPGALVSGTVVFSDGVKANWSLDQAGRLALGAKDKGYRPSAQDVQEFQMSIARELQKRGYA